MKSDRYKTIVVKVGTSTLVHENGKLNLAGMEKLVRVISDIKNSGKNVVLVTSGAVGTGAGRLGIKGKGDVKIKQALAAVGQGILMQPNFAYTGRFGKRCAPPKCPKYIYYTFRI